MWIFIRPFDVLFFRDNRPFTSGETHRAKSIFPSPLTFYGAIRAKKVVEEGIRFKEYREAEKNTTNNKLKNLIEIIGKPDEFKDIGLLGPFVAENTEKKGINCYFPVPFDVFERKDKKEFVLLRPIKKAFSVNEPSFFLWGSEEVKPTGGGFISKENLEQYLGGNVPKEIKSKEDFYKHELRVGIKLALPKKVSEIGMLYISDFLRFEKEAGFLVRVNNNVLENNGILTLGGEGKMAYYESVDLKDDKILPKRITEGGELLKIYLATPAIFEKGWIPDFLDNSFKYQNSNFECKLVSACVGKPIHIGGWNLKQNKPRSLYKAIPPGSVYFFEVDRDTGKFIEMFHNTTYFQSLGKTEFQSLGKNNDYRKDFSNLGFGLTFVGKWEYLEVEDV